MPSLHQLPKLEALLSKWIWNWILKLVETKNSAKGRIQIKTYIIKHINTNIRQNILSKIFSIHMYELEFSKKFELLEMFGDNNIKSIDLLDSGYLLIEEVYNLYRIFATAEFKNLSILGLSCRVKALVEQKYILEINSIFYKCLRSLKNLSCITMEELGDPLLLQTLGTSCPYLEYVNVKDSWLVNDSAVISLLYQNPDDFASLSDEDMLSYEGSLNPCSFNLAYLGISGTDIGFISILVSLISLPKLYSFGGYLDKSSVSDVITYLKSKQKNNLKLMLVELWEDNLTSEKILTLQETCPHLVSIKTDITSLNTLTYLNSCSLNSLSVDCDFKCCEIDLLDLLSLKGSTITKLILTKSVNTKIDILLLIEFTPRLIELEAPLQDSELLSDSSSLPEWRYLEIANISVNTIKCLKTLLKCSPILENLKLQFKADPYFCETHMSINDDLIFEVISNGMLNSLRYLSLMECGISIVGLEDILSHCKCLEYVEKLFFWKNLSPNDVQNLKKKIKINNWNLKIVLKEKYGDMDF